MFQDMRKANEMEKFLQKNFQNINKDLTIVKSVLLFKQLKHDLYNWSQIVSLANKLFMMFSIFFLLSGIFNLVIKGVPYMAGISALSLTKADLAVDKIESPGLIFGIYTIGILNALLAGAIAILGIIARSKLDIDLARISVLVLTISPFLLGSFMLATGILNFKYMEIAFEKKRKADSKSFNE